MYIIYFYNQYSFVFVSIPLVAEYILYGLYILYTIFLYLFAVLGLLVFILITKLEDRYRLLGELNFSQIGKYL